MNKYNILIGFLLLLIIFDNKIVEGLTLDICDKNENKFKLLNDKINGLDTNKKDDKNIVINNHLCNEGETKHEIEVQNDTVDGDENKDDGNDISYFHYIPKILIGILVLILLYFIIKYLFKMKNKIMSMTYDEAIENVKNAKVLKSKGIKLN